MRYAQYDRDTGAILKVGNCPASAFALQAGAYAVIAIPKTFGPVSDLSHRVAGLPYEPTVVPIED
jgi:hypothetical protein